jgi:hypothetical protein
MYLLQIFVMEHAYICKLYLCSLLDNFKWSPLLRVKLCVRLEAEPPLWTDDVITYRLTGPIAHLRVGDVSSNHLQEKFSCTKINLPRRYLSHQKPWKWTRDNALRKSVSNDPRLQYGLCTLGWCKIWSRILNEILKFTFTVFGPCIRIAWSVYLWGF